MAKSSTNNTSVRAMVSNTLPKLPSARAITRSRNNFGAGRYRTVYPSRQAFCARACASQDLPIPVGPVNRADRCCATQCEVINVRINGRSNPRGCRKSMSSTHGPASNLDFFSRRAIAWFSRQLQC